MHWRTLAQIIVLVAAGGSTARAAAKSEPMAVRAEDAAATTVTDFVDTPAGRRSYLQGALTKVRADAYLKLDAPPVPEAVELRGALAQKRDRLVTRHYARLAELDALADEATRGHDLRLAEHIEAARRRDSQRFFLAMQALKVQGLAFWAAGSR